MNKELKPGDLLISKWSFMYVLFDNRCLEDEEYYHRHSKTNNIILESGAFLLFIQKYRIWQDDVECISLIHKDKLIIWPDQARQTGFPGIHFKRINK